MGEFILQRNQQMIASLPIGKLNNLEKRVAALETSGGGGATTFIQLTDVPSSYAGEALKVVRVNAGATALEFVALAGGGDALTTDPLSQFAATTSLQLKGVISDETGSGALVFATSPTLVTPALGTPSSVVLTNATGLVSFIVADEATDTTCFPLFVTAATGELAPKTNSGITFNSNTGLLTVGRFTVSTNNFTIGASTPFSDTAGTLTLTNVDALDATTEATIEAAIDTLANLTSIQGRTITLADAGANAIFGWDDTAGAYENLTQAEARTVLGLGTAALVATDLADLNEATIEAAIDTLTNLTSVQGHTVTLTGAFIRSGAHSLTLTTGATTNVTLPASGTLAILGGDVWTGVHDFGGATSLEVPNGAGGTTINDAGEVCVDTTSDTFNFYDGTLEAVLTPIMSKSITIESPTSSEDLSMFYTDEAITVTKIVFVITGATSATTTIRHHTDRSNAGNEVVTSGTTANSTTTGNVVTSFNDATIPADSFVWLETTALSGTPTTLSVTVFYRQDA